MKGTSTQPDLRVVRASFEGYRSHIYDLFSDRATRAYRLVAVERLGACPGATVVDLGCGTGLSLPYLVGAVGPEGRVIGVDASPDMLAIARRRVERGGWRNVDLVEAFAHEWRPDEPVDAVFACSVNQLLGSAEVMRNAVSWLRPGGRIVCSGGKKGRGAGGLVRAALVWLLVIVGQREHSAGRWILHPRPWQELEPLLPDLQVEEVMGGNAFVAWGAKP
jgi:ubiquinone/menaquinone biosynthesis C-methylase UbiE